MSITIDAVHNRLDVVEIDGVERNKAAVEAEPARRMKQWTPLPMKLLRGTLGKYARLVCDASHGAITDKP